MALRYYMDLRNLKAEALRVEIHDTDFVGTAAEMDGDAEGFSMEYGGNGALKAGPMPSSCTVSFFHEGTAAHDALIDDIVSSKEGRFHLVVTRDGTDYPFYLVPDQVQVPDRFKNFHVILFGVDGIARLADIDYTDPADGSDMTGRETFVAHLFHIIAHIGLVDAAVSTFSSNLLQTTGNWYESTMDNTTCPYKQVTVDHGRFRITDREGNTRRWNCLQVLTAICEQFQCRFLYSGGGYHFQQIELYKSSTQKTYLYGVTGAYLGSTLVDHDTDIDYTLADGGRKLAGGLHTYTQGVKVVHVDYEHYTNYNRAQGTSFPPNTMQALPGDLIVNSLGEPEITVEIRLRFGITSVWAGAGNMPYHRYRCRVRLKFGNRYYRRHITDDIFSYQGFYHMPPSYEEDDDTGTTGPGWFTGEQQMDFWSDVYVPYISGQIKYHTFSVTTLPITVAALTEAPLEIQVDVLDAVDVDGNIYDGTSNLYFDWFVENPFVFARIPGEVTDVFIEDTERHTSEDTDGNNTDELEITTYFGDGPQPSLSVSRLRLFGGTDTELWQVGGTGDSYPLNTLLARQVLALRSKPLEVFQVTFLKGGILPTSRITDLNKNYMAVRLRYSGFRDTWEGDYVRVSTDAGAVIISDDPVQWQGGLDTSPIGPGPIRPPRQLPQVPPQYPDDGTGEAIFPPTAWEQGSVTLLASTQTATAINAPAVNTITVNARDYPFARAGDTVRLVNPADGRSQAFTVAYTYVPGSTELYVVEDAVMEFPAGTYVQPSAEMLARGSRWSYKDFGFTGTDIDVPTAYGLLPDPLSIGERNIDARVRVVVGGVEKYFEKNYKIGCYTIVRTGGLNRVQLWEKARDAHVLVVVD